MSDNQDSSIGKAVRKANKYKLARDEWSRKFMTETLAAAGGNMAEAARSLDMSYFGYLAALTTLGIRPKVQSGLVKGLKAMCSSPDQSIASKAADLLRQIEGQS